ncbi:MAG: heavy-metal-associated domain-containing protein, partial [Candidatus Lokiarchaeota archaeon]|nr:heavy-metal-associated domain-containing protein [Candidatus Lokiarchaeota archaeon]
MTCANCALKIEKKLKGLNGVENATVNFAIEEASVKYDPSTTGYKIFSEAIKDLGYKASLAKIDLHVIDELLQTPFKELEAKIIEIDGIYNVRGNLKASKLFIEFNNSILDENQVYNKIKKLGYNIEKVAGVADKEIEAHNKEMKYRLRILTISLI